MSDLYRDVIRVRATDSFIKSGGIKDGMFAFGRTSEKIIVRDDNGSPTPVYYEIGGGDSFWEESGTKLTPSGSQDGVLLSAFSTYNIGGPTGVNNNYYSILSMSNLTIEREHSYFGQKMYIGLSVWGGTINANGTDLGGNNIAIASKTGATYFIKDFENATNEFAKITEGVNGGYYYGYTNTVGAEYSYHNTKQFQVVKFEDGTLDIEKTATFSIETGVDIPLGTTYKIGGVPISTGASTFLDLTDTPSAYTGQAGQFVRVSSGEDALEFGYPVYNSLTDRPSTITLEPTGFESPEDVVMTGDLVAHTITLSGSGSLAYVNNVPTSIDGRTTPWTSPEHAGVYPGSRQIFLQSDGVTTEWSVDSFDYKKVQIAIGILNRTTGAVEFYQREIHGFIGWENHKNQHLGIGTQHISGGDESTIVLNSTTEANRRPTVSASSCLDEDNPFPAPTVAGSYTIMNIGADGAQWSTGNADIIPLLSNRPYWNNGIVQTLLDTTRFTVVYELENPGLLVHGRIFVQGQAQYNTITDARNAQPASLNLDGFNASELVFVRKYIIKYTSANWIVADKITILGTKVSQISFPSGSYLSQVSVDGTTITGNGADIALSVGVDYQSKWTQSGGNLYPTANPATLYLPDYDTGFQIGANPRRFSLYYIDDTSGWTLDFNTNGLGSAIYAPNSLDTNFEFTHGINIPTGQTYKINGVALSAANVGAEAALGNPATSGFILSSTTAGVRSWIDPLWTSATNGMTTSKTGISINGATLAANNSFYSRIAANANLLELECFSTTAAHSAQIMAKKNRNNTLGSNGNTVATDILFDFQGYGMYSNTYRLGGQMTFSQTADGYTYIPSRFDLKLGYGTPPSTGYGIRTALSVYNSGLLEIPEILSSAPTVTASYTGIYADTSGNLWSLGTAGTRLLNAWDDAGSVILSRSFTVSTIYSPTTAVIRGIAAYNTNTSANDNMFASIGLSVTGSALSTAFANIVAIRPDHELSSTDLAIQLRKTGTTIFEHCRFKSEGSLQINNGTASAVSDGAKLFAKDIDSKSFLHTEGEDGLENPICATGQVTMTVGGRTTNTTTLVKYQITGRIVTLSIEESTGTASGVTLTLSTLPVHLRPASNTQVDNVQVISAGITCSGACTIGTDGVITFSRKLVSGLLISYSSGAADTGLKGFTRQSFIYQL